MSETPQETVTRWLDEGSAVLTTPPEVREAIRAVLAELDRRRSFMQALSEVEPPREEGAMSETPQDVCKERDAWKERAWKQQARAEKAEAALLDAQHQEALDIEALDKLGTAYDAAATAWGRDEAEYIRTVARLRECGAEWPCPTRRALEGEP